MSRTRDENGGPWQSCDRILAKTESEFDFLTLVSATNIDEAWARFRDSGHQHAPELELPELDIDADAMRRRIDDLPLAGIEDVDVQFLLAGKHQELDWQLSMLGCRDTTEFRSRSMLHYGPVPGDLIREARTLLGDLADDNGNGEPIDADGVRERAEEELEHYRRQDPDFDAEIRQDEDKEALQASHGDLMVPADIKLPPKRLEALMQHEVGAHVVTWYNGSKQPLQVLRNGLAEYDELQEALGVLAEHFAGGLTPTRLRTLAGRAVAVHCLEEGADFVEAWRSLHHEHGISEYNAFSIVARIYTCCGLTRDQIYLRGLLWLLRYLATDGDLEPLYIGKIGPDHVPSIIRLRRRGFLRAPALTPAFFEGDGNGGKLDALRRGLSPRDLLEH